MPSFHANTIIAEKNPFSLHFAMNYLQQGYPIAFPTDTVYGVGVAAYNIAAIERLFALKQRPADKAIPVLIADVAQLATVATNIPPIAYQLAERHWPGSLTLVLPATDSLPLVLRAHQPSIAVRVPNHPWLLRCIRTLNEPLAATSANLHNAPTPTTAQAIADMFHNAMLPLIVQDDTTPSVVASTIVDCTTPKPTIIRQGALVVDIAQR